jgi:hypothetical protein
VKWLKYVDGVSREREREREREPAVIASAAPAVYLLSLLPACIPPYPAPSTYLSSLPLNPLILSF